MNNARKIAGAAVAAAVGISSFPLISSPAHAAPPSRITGTVTLVGSGPASGIKVTALMLGGNGQWAEADNVVTGVDGTYQIGKFDSGTYRIRFDDPTGAYETEFYNDRPRLDLAQDLELQPAGGKLQNIDAELGAAAHFAGRVLNSSSAGIPDAKVTAYVRQNAMWVEYQAVTTAANGSYDLGGLPGGVYTLGFFDPASGVSEFWNDKAELAGADSLSVTNDGTTSGLDATLATPIAPTTTPTTTTSATPATTPAGSATNATPAPVVIAMKTIGVTKAPRIRGTARVGNRLRVTSGTINPSAVVRKIQWLAGAKIIKKATKRRLMVTAKQEGKKITVRITISAPGYNKLVLKTRPTAKVRA